MRPLSGSCLCGGVRYKVADAFRYALNCHCSQCRRATGAAFKPFGGIGIAQLRITAGELHACSAMEMPTACDVHCQRCGSLLYSLVHNGATVHVTYGTLTEDAPTLESHRPYLRRLEGAVVSVSADDLPQYRGAPTMNMVEGWVFWALLSAVFAASTTVFARIGVAGVDADLATFLRTVLILLLLAAILVVGAAQMDESHARCRRARCLFLALSALATGASWVCYFRALQIGRASQVAPVDRLSLVLVALFAFAFLGERPTAAGLAGHRSGDGRRAGADPQMNRRDALSFYITE